MVVPLDQLKRHKCSKEGCAASYDELKDLWRHMEREVDHDYCDKCKHLAVDWDDLVEHKIKSPTAHIACKFCGEDFKSAGGRDRHIKMANIRCIGCSEHFVRAASLVQHLEFGHCTVITAEEFRSNLQHKHLIQKLLEDPENAGAHCKDWESENCSLYSESAGGVDLASQSGGGISVHESSHRGSSLLDNDNNTTDNSLIDLGGGGSLLPPIRPKVKTDIKDGLYDAKYPPLASSSTTGRSATSKGTDKSTSLHGAQYPPLSSSSTAGRSSSSKGTVKSKASKPAPVYQSMSNLMANLAVSEGKQTGGATSRAAPWPNRVAVPEGKQTGGATSRATPWPNRAPMSDTSSVTTAKAPTQSVISTSAAGGSDNVWGGSSKRLFPQARATPVSTDWDAELKARDEEYQTKDSSNMFRASFWDPSHEDYSPDHFFDALREKYLCPFPGCEQYYDEPYHLQIHIADIHAVTQVRCPGCHNLFKSTYALVAHCEAAVSRCTIGRSSNFGKTLNVVAGGFLGVNEVWRPDVTEEERKDRPDENGKTVHGSGIRIAHNQFHPTVPPEFVNKGPAKAQINRTWDNGVWQGRDSAIPTTTSTKVARDTEPVYKADLTRRPTYMLNYVAEGERRAGPPAGGEDPSWGKMTAGKNEVFVRREDSNDLRILTRKDMYNSRRGPEYEPSEREYDE
ncbi:hypothetical protein K490DRAFT_65750 [Saccharata proteae CBS 121410]|uniref:C2H2-type domain-containing protein n=1 Tax=Saccharata proteae CBS 121410 TaxID=1314787 RepID=A0A9P4LX87_9PEZI|nr:hypothetical protein K490DRAFT_65750 [Saccharata proteae CBS 121410]